MGRRPRYPSPDEAKERYVSGVQLAREKYVERATAGAEDFLVWFTGFASRIYPLVAGLPAKTGDTDKDIDNRVKPVSKAIKSLAKTYRDLKAREAAKKVAPAVPVR
jgi:hypothetical protein